MRSGSQRKRPKQEAGDVPGAESTRRKLLEAAGPVFAERGYYATTVREIAKRAGANIAAINYHFGDKLGLYTEVLQQSLISARVEAVEAVLDQDTSTENILRQLLKTRLRNLSRADVPDWHFRIMIHEFAQPSPVMSEVINKVTRPIYKRILELTGGFIGLPAEDEKTRLCAHSVMGQVLFYLMQAPLLLRLWPELKMTPEQVDRIADHITDFSLAYLRQLRANHFVD